MDKTTFFSEFSCSGDDNFLSHAIRMISFLSLASFYYGVLPLPNELSISTYFVMVFLVVIRNSFIWDLFGSQIMGPK